VQSLLALKVLFFFRFVLLFFLSCVTFMENLTNISECPVYTTDGVLLIYIFIFIYFFLFSDLEI